MHFLYISESPHPSFGGASKCIYTLFSYLTKYNHRCTTIGPGGDSTFVYKDVKVIHSSNIYNTLLSVLQEDPPDIVITQLTGADTVQRTLPSHIPLILRIPSFEFICNDPIKMGDCSFPCLQGSPCAVKGAHFDLFKKTAVIGCSDFVSNIVQKIYNVPCTTVYPFIDIQEHLVESTGNCITMVQGTPLKGVELFLDIATKCPEYHYLIVGFTSVSKFPTNVEHVPPTENMKQVWQRTKVLLIPSLVQEAFGRVAVEAAINGIPVIASNKGGLPEAVSRPFCLPARQSELWISELKQLMENDVYYGIRSTQAKEYASRFSLVSQVSKFLQIAYTFKYPDLPPTNTSTKVSIITSVYKAGDFLEKYFNWICSQTYKNLEIVLILNDPSERELSIVGKYVDKLEMQVVQVPLEPVTESYNRAYKIASGDILLVASVDDTLREDAIHRYVYTFETTAADVVYCDHVRVTSEGSIPAPKVDFNINTLKQFFYLGPHVAIHRRIVESGEFLNTEFLYAADYEYYLRLAVKGYKFARIPIELSTYLERPEAITYSYRQEQIDTTEKIKRLYA